MFGIRKRIEANQEFYNGVAVGLGLGVIGTLLLVINGTISTSTIGPRPEDMLTFGFTK